LLAAVILRERITPARAAGLALIVAGDLLVGGASLLQAFSGGDVWRGDLLFMSAAFCWSVYSVLARKHGLDAVEATIAVTVFAAVFYLPGYALSAASGFLQSRLAAGAMDGNPVPAGVPGHGFGGDIRHHLHLDDPALRTCALDHDHGPGARPFGAGRSGVPGRASSVEPAGGAGAGHCRHPVRREGCGACCSPIRSCYKIHSASRSQFEGWRLI
jgi:hypothetical protein